MIYPEKANAQLQEHKTKHEYKSHFWLTEDEIEAIQSAHTIKVKPDQKPVIIFEPLPEPKYVSLFNADQFEDPHFVKLWALTARFRGKSINQDVLKWKTIGSLLRRSKSK